MEQSGDQYDDKRPLQWLQLREWSPIWSGIQCWCMQWYYIYSKVLANIQFPGLIISGGTDRRSTEIFPAQISCAIPSFPDEGNLSIFILIFVFAIHFIPRVEALGPHPFPYQQWSGYCFVRRRGNRQVLHLLEQGAAVQLEGVCHPEVSDTTGHFLICQHIILF